MSKTNIGRIIGKYKIVEHLGRGGMADVYKAYQDNLDRYVALKLMHPFLADDQDFLRRFQREARAMAAINHPHIVGVFDFDVEDDTYYIVMEYIGGGTLKERQEQLAASGEQMSLEQAVKIILQVADALAFAHGRDMIHRDIKPANVMLNDRGDAVLTDFGIAKMMSGPTYTATGAMIGTPAYMSPEQAMGQSGDERSDLYSLGVLFFELVTGQLPYDAETPLAVVLKHVNEPIPHPRDFNTDLPLAIETVLLKSLEKDPADRYPSVHEFARALRQALSQSPLAVGGVLPAALLRDRPTPMPTAATMVAVADQTQVAVPGDATVVAPSAETAGSRGGGRRWGVLALGLIVILLFLAGGAYALRAPLGLLPIEASPSPIANTAVIPTVVTPSPEPTEDFSASATQTIAAILASNASPTPSHTPTPTAEVTVTAEVEAEETVEPTRATLTPSPTSDPTADFLATCTTAVRLLNSYTSPNPSTLFAEIEQPFTLNWEIENSGTCPLPQDLRLVVSTGEDFGLNEATTLSLAQVLAAGESTTLSLELTAPPFVNAYETGWQLQDANGNLLGTPFTTEVRTYVPATPTPAVTNTPTPLPASIATATPEVANAGPVDFNYFLGECEYPGGGTEWRCEMTITPFGGIGPDYTTWVFDSDQPARYFGGNQTHFVQGRRCFPWINEVKVQDEASGENISKNVYIDPTAVNNFPGGTACTES